jgi:phage major head subunit gpT-like protein
MIINSATLIAANKGFKKLYDGGLGSVTKPRVNDYCLRSPSSSDEEKYAWLGALPGMRKLVGEINIRNLVDHGFPVKNEEFEVTVAVKRKDIERDKLGVYSAFFTAMGRSAGQHPDELLAAALTGAFTTPCYTGKNFFDTNHEPQKGKIKFSNKGTKKLSAANFVLALQSMENRKDAEGQPINGDPKFVLIVSPKYRETAENILVASTLANGQANVNKGKARLDVWNRLAGAATEDMWFVIDENGVVKPFVYQVELETEYIAATDPKSEHAILQKEYIYQAYGRYNVAALVPELAYGSTGVDAA